jgi:tRNA-dihydrouridine synthase
MIIHARNCVLKGLTPAQNRTIPPLCYQKVYDLASYFPDMNFSINGGITSFDEAERLLFRYREYASTSLSIGDSFHREIVENSSLSSTGEESSSAAAAQKRSFTSVFRASNESSLDNDRESARKRVYSETALPSCDASLPYKSSSLNSPETIREYEPVFYGVMIGRAAYNNPWIFAGKYN